MRRRIDMPVGGGVSSQRYLLTPPSNSNTHLPPSRALDGSHVGPTMLGVEETNFHSLGQKVHLVTPFEVRTVRPSSICLILFVFPC